MSYAPPIATSFFEIFKHAWPIMWERASSMLTFIFIVCLIVFLGEHILSLLTLDLEPSSLKFTEEPTEQNMALFFNKFKEIFTLDLVLLMIMLQLLFTALINLFMARTALGLWDGYAPNQWDLVFILKNFFRALIVTFMAFLFQIYMALILLVCFLPVIILSALHPLAALVGLAITIYLFVILFWPRFRKIAFISFFTLFRISDGHQSGLWAEMQRLYLHLSYYPLHLNQAALLLLLYFFPILPLMSILFSFIPIDSEPMLAQALDLVYIIISQILYFWLILSLSGFYRLFLTPLQSQADLAELQPNN